MYNCKFFPDHYINGRLVPGICRNVLKAFELNGAGVGPFTGTYKMRGPSQKDDNRKWACEDWSGHEFEVKDKHGVEHKYDNTWVERCSLESAVLGRMTGLSSGPNGNVNWLSCDEFPFNSWEEGGLNKPNSRSCVPGYQQDLQGIVNGLQHWLEQKVTWVNSAGQTVTSRDYKDWHTDWLGVSAVGPITKPVNKDTAWNHAENNRKSLSMHLFNSDSDDTVLGTKYQVFNHKIIAGPGTTETDIGLVVAAINTMDNPKYRFKGSGMNAYCHRLALGFKQHQYWGTANAATTKIKRGKQPTVQELFNITSIEFDDDDLDIDIPLPADMAEQLFAEEDLAEHGHHDDDAPHNILSHPAWGAAGDKYPCLKHVIAAAVASDELRGASTLSLCVDQFKLEGDEEEGDLNNLAAALAQSTALKQLCFLQRPDRNSDDASARFCSQQLLLWGGHQEEA
ncbi:hypothetical protein BJX63DRAFT_428482 [Aspergillus granulosus]|uniref:Deoxyribonuclease NucA/NucB domain-containing protein n=1 Tax=Aspergillus granulosus TaxID=176169 RepID=A0ABR4HW36_9EURO